MGLAATIRRRAASTLRRMKGKDGKHRRKCLEGEARERGGFGLKGWRAGPKKPGPEHSKGA